MLMMVLIMILITIISIVRTPLVTATSIVRTPLVTATYCQQNLTTVTTTHCQQTVMVTITTTAQAMIVTTTTTQAQQAMIVTTTAQAQQTAILIALTPTPAHTPTPAQPTICSRAKNMQSVSPAGAVYTGAGGSLKIPQICSNSADARVATKKTLCRGLRVKFWAGERDIMKG